MDFNFQTGGIPLLSAAACTQVECLRTTCFSRGKEKLIFFLLSGKQRLKKYFKKCNMHHFTTLNVLKAAGLPLQPTQQKLERSNYNM